jgi:hypothetical protein
MLKILFLPTVWAAFLAGALTPAAQAQYVYAGPGTAVLGQTWTPYSAVPLGFYPCGYAYEPPLYVYAFVSPPSRYLTPSYSYQANPYASFPTRSRTSCRRTRMARISIPTISGPTAMDRAQRGPEKSSRWVSKRDVPRLGSQFRLQAGEIPPIHFSCRKRLGRVGPA